MAYATPDDIAALYGRDQLARLADADDDRDWRPKAEQALVYAAAQLDAYIAVRYALPLPATPDLIKILTIDVALYRLAQDHARLTDEIAKRYDAAIAQARDIAAGKCALPMPLVLGAAPAPAGPTLIVSVEGADRVMDRRDLRRL